MEPLEDRTLLSPSPLLAAVPLNFNAISNTAQVSHSLSSPGEVDLYSVALKAGDTIQAGISAQDAGNQAGASFMFPFPGNGNKGDGLAPELMLFRRKPAMHHRTHRRSHAHPGQPRSLYRPRAERREQRRLPAGEAVATGFCP